MSHTLSSMKALLLPLLFKLSLPWHSLPSRGQTHVPCPSFPKGMMYQCTVPWHMCRCECKVSAVGIGGGEAPDQHARANQIPRIAMWIFAIQINKMMLNLTCYVTTDASCM